MNNAPIGVFDSGLGGLTAVRELKRVLPNEDIVYFGDTGRVPYGTRSNSTIKKYAFQDAKFLLKHNVKMVIAACGTVSSVATNLKTDLPVPYTGVVSPTCFAAAQSTKNKIVGVIGTSATINSHSYRDMIQTFDSEIKVVEQDCPLFVPLVENGFIDKDDPITRLVIERYLGKIIEAKADTIIQKKLQEESAKVSGSSHSSYHREKELDNMRGFDPASEDDMDDNGMQRYFDANDEEAWD